MNRQRSIAASFALTMLIVVLVAACNKGEERAVKGPSAPGGSGAIARYLSNFGAGIQQVEYRCSDLECATALLQQEFDITPVYPHPRPGADGTRINFFLVAASDGGKILVELYELAKK